MHRYLSVMAATAALSMVMAGTPALAGGGSDTTGEGFHCYAFFTFDDDPDKFVQAMINEEFADDAEEKINEVLDKYEDEGATLEFLTGNVGGVCESTHTCSPLPDKFVFLSSTTTHGDIGGQAGANQICNELATNARLQGGGDSNYLAWISGELGTPDALFVHHPGRYVLPDGTVIAYNWDDLTNGNINNPIDRDESGTPRFTSVVRNVWTGTFSDGTLGPTTNCATWTSNDFDVVNGGWAGDFRSIDPSWSSDGRARCGPKAAFPLIPPLRLYCFEQ